MISRIRLIVSLRATQRLAEFDTEPGPDTSIRDYWETKLGGSPKMKLPLYLTGPYYCDVLVQRLRGVI